jgi:acyl dehydratase
MTAKAATGAVASGLEGRITAEGVAFMRSRIGVRTPVRPWNSVASADAIWHFALGLGDDNPLWSDEAYARATRWGGIIAPPTFLYSACAGPRRPQDPPGAWSEDFLPGVLAMQAGDRWIWHRPVREGERIFVETGLHSVEEKTSKTGGRSVIEIHRMGFAAADGELLAELYKTRIRMERASTRQSAAAAPRVAPRYSPAEAERFRAHYRAEADARRGREARFWDEVNLGQMLPRILKGPLTVTNLVGWLMGWGAPLCLTNRMASEHLERNPGARLVNEETGIEDSIEAAHWDAYFAAKSGLGTGYDFGPQRVAWAAHLVTDWMGDDGELKALDARVRRPNLLGDITWFDGKVCAKREHGLVDLEIVAINQNGETTLSATATVALPVRG